MRRIVFLLIILILYPVSCCYSDSSKESTVKVLLYHNVTAAETNQNNPYVVSLAGFEKQIRWLQENGYVCMTVSEMFQSFAEGGITGKTAVITFDDGYPDVYTYAFPVLSAYGFPATTYLVAEKIDSLKNLTAEMIRDLYDAG
ncbi:MAG: polysaccharide deacetylase family protein [Anaerolineaceae bacterium]|nr:polysaccharide deacetylase family protein [Anaerolineaceae bacterium]